jgi:hypothetical protein
MRAVREATIAKMTQIAKEALTCQALSSFYRYVGVRCKCRQAAIARDSSEGTRRSGESSEQIDASNNESLKLRAITITLEISFEIAAIFDSYGSSSHSARRSLLVRKSMISSWYSCRCYVTFMRVQSNRRPLVPRYLYTTEKYFSA